jgi:hypothetical protein
MRQYHHLLRLTFATVALSARLLALSANWCCLYAIVSHDKFKTEVVLTSSHFSFRRRHVKQPVRLRRTGADEAALTVLEGIFGLSTTKVSGFKMENGQVRRQQQVRSFTPVTL